VNFDAFIVSTPPSQGDYSGKLQFRMVQFIGGRARSQTPEGVHGFVDIGAGTVDACIFRISRYDHEPSIPVLSARVANLGTASIANGIVAVQDAESRSTLEEILVSPIMPSSEISSYLSGYVREIENFTAGLVLQARDKMIGRALVHDPVQFLGGDHGQLKRSFRFHSTGGGALSAWYRRTMEGVYIKRSLQTANLMSWSVSVAQPPSEFPSADVEFSRFIIAWGLTAEGAALEELRMFLPSQIDAPPPPISKPKSVPVYEGH
jgi:hypothetical protein